MRERERGGEGERERGEREGGGKREKCNNTHVQ